MICQVASAHVLRACPATSRSRDEPGSTRRKESVIRIIVRGSSSVGRPAEKVCVWVCVGRVCIRLVRKSGKLTSNNPTTTIIFPEKMGPRNERQERDGRAAGEDARWKPRTTRVKRAKQTRKVNQRTRAIRSLGTWLFLGSQIGGDLTGATAPLRVGLGWPLWRLSQNPLGEARMRRMIVGANTCAARCDAWGGLVLAFRGCAWD